MLLLQRLPHSHNQDSSDNSGSEETVIPKAKRRSTRLLRSVENIDEESKKVNRSIDKLCSVHLSKVGILETHQRETTREIAELKRETAGLKMEIAGLKRETAGQKMEIAGLKRETAGQKMEIAELKREMASQIDQKI